MELIKLSLSPDDADAKAAFHKPLNDATSRKYRRRSPPSGSSSSDGSPKHVHSSSPINSREKNPARDSYPWQRKDDVRNVDRNSGRNHHGWSGRHSDQHSSRSSHNYCRRDDYVRHEKHTDEEERNYTKSSSCSGLELRVGSQSDHTRRESENYRTRDYLRGDDKHSRDKSDGSGNRSRDKNREISSQKDKDSLSDRAGSGRRYTNSNAEDTKYGQRDRHKWDGDDRDEKRGYRRSLRDYKSDCSPVYEEYRGYQNDSTSRRDSAGHRLKETSKSDPRELDVQKYTKEEKKYDDWESSKSKDRYDREPGEQFEDKTSENQESSSKKPRLFSLGTDYGQDVSKFTTVADERQSSSSKQAQELVGKVTSEQVSMKGSEVAKDIDAAKVAAMKAAELVNRNLLGTGYMSTDQKKKLLWGNKKNTTSEESGHRWDMTLFSDRERQEKFNKLMSLRLPWYIWPIVGREGRPKSGAQARQSRKQWPPSRREAEGTTSAGFGEAIYCWTPSERWPHCWTRSLKVCLLRMFFFCIYSITFSCTMLQQSPFLVIWSAFVGGISQSFTFVVSHEHSFCKSNLSKFLNFIVFEFLVNPADLHWPGITHWFLACNLRNTNLLK